jgi:integral membrane sensor domain MASE1
MNLKTLLPRLLLVALAYYLCGRLGLTLASYGSQVTLIWPPTGVALFALLAWGTRMAPAIGLAAFLVNLPLSGMTGATLAIAAGNTLGPLLAALALNRFGFNRDFRTARDVFLYVGVGALAGMAVNATVGTSTLVLTGALPGNIFHKVWLTWWMGDALGALLLGPALLTLLRPPPARRPCRECPGAKPCSPGAAWPLSAR